VPDKVIVAPPSADESMKLEGARVDVLRVVWIADEVPSMVVLFWTLVVDARLLEIGTLVSCCVLAPLLSEEKAVLILTGAMEFRPSEEVVITLTGAGPVGTSAVEIVVLEDRVAVFVAGAVVVTVGAGIFVFTGGGGLLVAILAVEDDEFFLPQNLPNSFLVTVSYLIKTILITKAFENNLLMVSLSPQAANRQEPAAESVP